jgi:hypothetical protein
MRCIERFTDDYGNVIIPGYMSEWTYAARYYYFKGEM